MEKQKILDQVEEESARKIIMKIDAEKKGAIVACSVGIVALLIWNIVEYVVFSFVDWGGNIAFFAMLGVALLARHKRLGKTADFFIGMVFILLSFFSIVAWILQIMQVLPR